MIAHAVIGANYGDEGKGLVTDYLASRYDQDDTVVVRFNGGAQAGHTVVLGDGTRHVHHHFGSGTLAGYPTFLSRHFIVNPIVFTQEWGKIMDLTTRPPTVWVDPDAPVTTPYDMMLNQAAELARGSARHGSCGLGINETVQRHEYWPLTVKELRQSKHVEAFLRQIRKRWVPRRMHQLGLTKLPEYLMNDGVIERWLRDVEIFLASVRERSWGPYWEVAIFEGAQGLRLDAFSADFPYVTRSRTGLTNVVELLDQARVPDFDVYYVSRSYVTRHGAGPLPHELAPALLPYPDVRDDTNVPNPWQQALRFGALDIERHLQTVVADLARAGGRARPHQVLTCMDQVGDLPIRMGETMVPQDLFLPWWISLLEGDGLVFYGPTRHDAVPLPHDDRRGKLRLA